MDSIYRYREVRTFTFPWPPMVYGGFLLSEAICCYLLLHRPLIVAYWMWR